jgi:3'-phosphoadenosine 5'-phosphosulfate (PAPS) 3'-phosphatase
MADLYINLVPGFKYWDMCASEALIEAKMGICVDVNGSPFIYDHDAEDYTVQNGIVIAKNLIVYNMIMQRCAKNLGMPLTEFYKEVQEETRIRHAKKEQ